RNTPSEQQAERYFDSIRNQHTLLYAFLRKMPKGGDLHNHLSGSVYAETYIEWAAQAGLCVDRQTLVALPPPCSEASGGRPPVRAALSDVVLYRRMIDAWSMRNWEYSGQSGHDHFFDTFAKFGLATDGRFGEMTADVASRASSERVSYMELMLTPDNKQSSQLGSKLGWDEDFGKMRERLLANGLREVVASARKVIDDMEAKRRAILGCGNVQAGRGCEVTIRYLYQVSRGIAPEEVFAQILTGFEMASVDSRVVGLNLVMPEDWLVPMRDFSLHMRMLDYLHRLYPKVHITLHAGELAPGMVPPVGLSFHIRQSVEMGHAERIGHGIDVMQEDDAVALLREMAERNVMVEICLTSNDSILGVRGSKHPLAAYMMYGVPVALATDDEGVSRSEMTLEYLKAVEEQGLNYAQLKAMARTSLEHAFIAGESLWSDARRFTSIPQCANAQPSSISPGCRQFLEHNSKAQLEWKLEAAFREFEERY
ncbi:MAG TPA: hypothetical protein VK619_07780, partial [Pyrinomonadaceae bacterium]|nr:hypothetical protein [Pyrinomonadaceae bacterium]